MPLGAARIALLAKTQVVASAEVIRKQVGVSAVGNAQIDTAQSKFGGASYLSDGTGDYLEAYPQDLTAFGTDNFTLECFVRLNSTGIVQYLFDARNAAGSTANALTLQVRTDNKVYVFINNAYRITSTGTLSGSTWHHLALVRDGDDLKLYINGTNDGTWSGISATSFVASQTRIGSAHNAGASWNGHIDEFRISNTARYTANFTPATTPFVNDENTLLLLHMDGTDASTVFEDDNGVRDKIAAVAVADAQIDTAQSQFGGASALFDRTGDGIRLYNVDSFGVGTGDITIEMWFRSVNVSHAAQTLYDQRDTSNGNWPALFINNDSGTVKVALWWNGNYRLYSDQTISANTWYHVALTRESGVWYIYVDGTKTTSSYSASDSIVANDDAQIGFNFNSANVMDGHIDEVRISNTARYTTSFTPSTTPFQNDSNTLLLMHMDGTDGSTYFEDDNGVRSKVGVSALASAEINTTQSKFGGSSLYIDAAVNGSALNVNRISDEWDVTTTAGAKTFECWVYNSNTNSTDTIFGNRTTGASTVGWQLWMEPTGLVRLYGWDSSHAVTVSLVSGSSVLSDNTWHHIAYTWDGTDTHTVYVDGTSIGSATSSTVSSSPRTFNIGDDTGGGSREWNGYIDEVRVSDTVRYTANFTPPTEPFQNDDNTLLLLHMDGTDGSTDFIDDNGVDTLYWG